MRVDAHHHFWRYNPAEYDWISDEMSVIQKDYLPGHLIEQLQSAQFDGSVVVQARQTAEETRWLLELAREHRVIKGVVGWIDLLAPDLRDMLDEYKTETKLKGFRHVLEGEPDPDFMLQENFCLGVQTLAEYGYSYDLLVRSDQLPQTASLVRQLPPMRLVVDHIAKPDIKRQEWHEWSEGLSYLASFDHVHCKISGMVTEADWYKWKPTDFEPYLEHVFQVFGPERVMFGSDWPVCQVAGNYQQVYTLVSDFVRRRYPTHEVAIFGSNAVAFYGL